MRIQPLNLKIHTKKNDSYFDVVKNQRKECIEQQEINNFDSYEVEIKWCLQNLGWLKLRISFCE